MSNSGQKFVARNRAPRVQIEYDVELYGSEKSVQLPFVMGVMADLAGSPAEPLPAVADRSFLEIDSDNFDDRMKAIRPRAAFTVPNTLTGEGSLSVDLTFERMEAFSPAEVARKIPPLRKLLEARTQLAHLSAYMDGKSGAEALIAELISSPETLSALVGAPAGGSDPVARQRAMQSLRDALPARDDAENDTLTAAFDALRAASDAPAAPEVDALAAAFETLRDAAPAEQPAPGNNDAAFADLLANAPVAEEIGPAQDTLPEPAFEDETEAEDETPGDLLSESTAPEATAFEAAKTMDDAFEEMSFEQSPEDDLPKSAPEPFEDAEIALEDAPETPDAAAEEGSQETEEALPFGTLSAERPEDLDAPRERFRIAILSDFSGRASRGALAIGDDLARRRPIRFDVDRLDAVMAGFATTLTLPVGRDGAAVEVPLRELDDLHPDELYENVALFEELAALRQRVARGEAAALAELQGWAEAHGRPMPASRARAKGSAVPADRRLSAFQSLIGDMQGALSRPSPAADLIARIVGPHVQAAASPAQDSQIAAIDAALSDAMRTILHHPDFQAVEATWRALEFLARRIETGPRLEIVLYDVSAEEWAADLSAQEDLAESGLFRMLGEEPRLDAQQGPISAVFGLYTLEETPPHAALLARMGKIAAWMNAPFVTAISPRFLDTAKQDRHPLVAEAWDALRALPESRHLGIAAPRFLLRHPYGRRTDPIEPFAFEEFSLREGLHGMLWANPAVLSATLLAASVTKSGKNMRLGEIMSLGDMPVHVMTDAHGDQVALPCTERLLNTRTMAEVVTRGFMPLLSIKGRNEVRQGSFQALGGDMLAGPWALAPGKGKGGHETSVGFGKPPAGVKPATASAPDSSEASDDDPMAAFGEEDGLPDMGETTFPDFGEDDAAPDFDAGDLPDFDTGDLPDFDGEDAFADFASSDMPDFDSDGTPPDMDADTPGDTAEDGALPAFDDSDLDDMLAAFGDDADTPADGDGEMDPALAAMLEDL